MTIMIESSFSLKMIMMIIDEIMQIMSLLNLLWDFELTNLSARGGG